MTLTAESTFHEIETAMHELPYPSRPVKPSSLTLQTAADARAFAERMEEYESAMTLYNAAMAVRKTEYAALQKLWHEKLRADYPLLSDTVFNLCYAKAYERGHSSGYSEIRGCMDDYTDFAWNIILTERN